MKTSAISIIALFLVAAWTVGSFAQAPSAGGDTPEKAAVLANDHAYEEAYAKGDVKTLANFFAEDAEFTSEDGRTFRGRAEIEAGIRAGLSSNKGARLAITVDSVKVLSPEVVLEKGATSVTSKSGETSGALYTAIHQKKDGQWKIIQLIETPLPEVSPHDRLTELEWLVGKWQDADKGDDLSVQSEYSWARGENFLTRNVTVKRGGKVTLEGSQIIGWDPVEERIRTWSFDGEGGFSDGYFTRDGDRWLLRETGVAPDGSRTASDNTITKLSADRYTWESTNRSIDGEPQPSIGRIEINRVKGK
ncbi:MAG TPA: nuclear transport factor 2 family protein [Verrucomicrobiaceae bacterium]|jgi:uncharacterized protein (TIGR02246 family)